MTIDNLIPGYSINTILHEGLDTIVYRAINLQNKRPFILKSLKEVRNDDTKAARLSKEFDTLENIGISGVPRVAEMVHLDSKPVLVMEDFGGVSLSEYCKSSALVIDTFLPVAIQLADILSKLHAKNIMHKDVNPENIIIHPTTGEVRLIDFGISAQLSREHTTARNPHKLEGSLPYMSPEQTGRMNRSVDYRTDLYSLGITFYQLLSGRLPFQTDDALELIHCHLARKITPLIEVSPSVPQVLSDIVSKLTAKIADERYQSAVGLKHDLEHCQRSMTPDSDIPFFTIGLQDVFSKFKIPEHLYGREREADHLLRCFEDVADGGCRLMLITGPAGIGKTALVNEIHKSILQKTGYFIAGKFDQFKTNIPFHAFRQAFSELFKYLISEPKEKLESIRTELLQGLGVNASILTDLVPEFELILGQQTAPYELNPAEAQNRFFFTLRDFIKVFATQTHPLVIFLDDLQWSDDASLRLVKELVTKELPFLFLIGAYRNNEISEGHPLAITIDGIKKAKQVDEVSLQPLDETNVNQLIADALLTPLDGTCELTQFMFKRTGGNPFYINEILKTIYREGHINFDYTTGHWTWNMPAIANLNISDNVVQFMTERLKELPPDCIDILQWASCMGSSFQLKIIKLVTHKTASDIAAILWPAIEKELVVPLSEDYRLVAKDFDLNVGYKFLHDRIRQAAYSLIPEERRKEMNLAIARMLLQHFSEAEKTDHLIELVRHYNEGRTLITDSIEKLGLAKMNAAAGKKAQAAVAYQSAVQYFKTGIELLPADLWDTHYPLTFELYKGYAQNAYQTADAQKAEECIALLLQKAKTRLEKVEILSIRVRQYNTVGRAEEAIRSGIEGLALLGYKVPENPGALVVLKEILLAKWNLGKRKAADLLNAPLMQDEEKRAAARLLTEIAPAAYVLGRDNLFGLTQLKIVNLSLIHGNCPEAAYAYITFGTVQKEAFGDLKSAENFGRLGLAINEKLDDIEYRCRAIAAYGVLTHHFNNHWNTTGEWFKKGMEAGHLSGDLFYLAYCAANCFVWNPALTLQASLTGQLRYMEVVKDTNYEDAIDFAVMNIQVTKNRLGLTNDAQSMNDDEFNEEECLQRMTARKYTSGMGMYHIYKAELFLADQAYQLAWASVLNADQYTKSLVSLINMTKLCIVSFFSASGCLNSKDTGQKEPFLKRMKKEAAKMKKWAAYNPINFQQWHQLMEAELCTVQNKYAQATKLFEAAIQSAKQNDWPADEAFANETAALFYEAISSKVATAYMQEAIRLYEVQGYVRKQVSLQHKYPQAIPSAHGVAAKKEQDNSQGLDVATIVRSSQAISGEIELKSLLQKMMRIIMMNAGAENGTLLLAQNNELYIQAEAKENEVTTMQNLPVIQSKELPQSIINYVSNAKEAVVLDNASVEGKFTTDAYILAQKPKSVLCSPVVLLNKLYGVLYLENNMSVGAFTEERLKILHLLSSQMAISLQNALLYASLEEKVEERTVELLQEKKKSDDLLMNILPLEVANELKRNGYAEARQFDQVTVLFTDFVNFTSISESMTPKELVAEIHHYFTAFDEITERNGLEKIKTIGDAYLAVAGLLKEDPNHASNAARAALEMVAYVQKRKSEGALFNVRAGLNSGPVVAGIVGVKKFVYDIWGDTVNTAARMETASEPGKVNCTAATYNLLPEDFICSHRGKLAAKNKGMIDMYFIEERKESQ